MTRQSSTALSDFVLAVSAIWGFRVLSESPVSDFQFGKWFFMLETLAAFLGVVRFGELMPNYQASVLKHHINFSWLCRAIGIPCLASEVCRLYKLNTLAQGFLFSAVATFITSSVRSHQKERVTDLVNAVSVMAIIGISVTGGNGKLLIAGVLFALSGLVGSEGDVRLLNMHRVDILHYILVAVNYFIVAGLSE